MILTPVAAHMSKTAPRPKLAALAVVIHEGAALLVQRANAPGAGLWGFPGGHVEWGETVMAAAARELREETSVVATPRDFITNVDVIVPDETGAVTHHFLLVAVRCDYVSGTPLAGDDARDTAWVPLADILQPNTSNRPLSANVTDVLRRALGH